MQKFRKKPVVVEAMQFDGTLMSGVAIEEWTAGKAVILREYRDAPIILEIRSSDDYTFDVTAGEWVIKDDEGVTKVPDDVFKNYYEPVKDKPQKGD